jgi:hypothetical protein
VEFGSQPVGTVSAAKSVMAINKDRNLTVPIKSTEISGAGASDFLIETSICNAANVPAGQSCSVDVRFTPKTTGKLQATLLIHRVDRSDPLVVSLNGEGAQRPLSFQPTADFGQIAVGSTGIAKTIPVTNVSGQALVMQGLTLTGDNPNDFSMKADPAGCVLTVAPGGTCVVTVSFSPTATGDRSASLAFSYQGSGSPLYLRLTGAGASLSLTVSPTRLDFGSQPVGTASGPLSVTMSTPLGTVVTIGTVTLSGPDATYFTINSDGCSGKTLGSRVSCTVTLTFVPKAIGVRLAFVSLVRSDEINTVSSVQLNGFGFVPRPPRTR